MARALNIKINDSIYEKLHQCARSGNLTKTRIVELALERLFSENSVDSVGSDVDESDNDVDNHVDNTKNQTISQLQQSISALQSQIDKLYEGFHGLSCPIDVDSIGSNIDTRVDDAVDKLSHHVESYVEDSVDSSVESDVNELSHHVESYVEDSVDSSVDTYVEDTVEKLQNGLTQKQLAQRLNCAPSTVFQHKKKSPHQWDEFCANRDPLSLYWKLQGKRFYPSNVPTDPNWQLTDAHLSCGQTAQ